MSLACAIIPRSPRRRRPPAGSRSRCPLPAKQSTVSMRCLDIGRSRSVLATSGSHSTGTSKWRRCLRPIGPCREVDVGQGLPVQDRGDPGHPPVLDCAAHQAYQLTIRTPRGDAGPTVDQHPTCGDA